MCFYYGNKLCLKQKISLGGGKRCPIHSAFKIQLLSKILLKMQNKRGRNPILERSYSDQDRAGGSGGGRDLALEAGCAGVQRHSGKEGAAPSATAVEPAPVRPIHQRGNDRSPVLTPSIKTNSPWPMDFNTHKEKQGINSSPRRPRNSTVVHQKYHLPRGKKCKSDLIKIKLCCGKTL